MLCLILGGCSKEADRAPVDDPKPEIYTVNYPLAYFAERIAGDQAQVVFPAIEGDPAFWKPTAGQISAFQEADLILLNGASYAKWTSQASLPQSRLLDTSSSFRDRFILAEGEPSHSHGPVGDHSHGNTAFTTWLDLSQAVEQAAAINAKLALPESGFAQLNVDLMAMDEKWEAAFSKISGQPILGSHPVYQYLARRYHLDLKSVHWEPEVGIEPDMWNELEALIRTHPAKIMLWEGDPLPETKTRLLQAGIRSIVFDPCGNRPENGDFLSVMEENLARLEKLISTGKD